jgi:curved DNA-binding protein CbpA
MDHYDTLGVAKDATQEEIKKARNKKAREHHPDKHGGDTSKMAEVNKAYDVLSDPLKRERYDNGEDDPKEFDISAHAFGVMRGFFEKVASRVPPKYVFEALTEELQNGKTSADTKIKGVNKKLKLLVEMRQSVRTKPGVEKKENHFDILLDSVEHTLREEITNAERAKAVFQRALDLMSNLEPVAGRTMR